MFEFDLYDLLPKRAQKGCRSFLAGILIALFAFAIYATITAP